MGNVAEWVSAVVALCALIAAVWAARTSRNLYETSRDLYKVESKRDEKSREREKRIQASGIASWCVRIIPHDGSALSNGILVHNSTDSPVYDVEVTSIYSVSKGSDPVKLAPFTMEVLPPGDFVAGEHPKYGWTFPDQREDIDGIVRPITKNRNWRVVTLKFTDSYGLRWMRDKNGLEEIPVSAQA
ncbi:MULTISPECIES: hypothetical protein [Brevibacterium]|uniref:Uncharacterized protein n=1 Tax=Brevibacterium casei TaxID=33889 RepID=A0A7T3ZYB1_9MICO|nr:hypothetical protein [Brevibacterium casei]QQB13935.1 hypothetical protein I6H47_14305 [Brevibacterium casei]